MLNGIGDDRDYLIPDPLICWFHMNVDEKAVRDVADAALERLGHKLDWCVEQCGNACAPRARGRGLLGIPHAKTELGALRRQRLGAPYIQSIKKASTCLSTVIRNRMGIRTDCFFKLWCYYKVNRTFRHE